MSDERKCWWHVRVSTTDGVCLFGRCYEEGRHFIDGDWLCDDHFKEYEPPPPPCICDSHRATQADLEAQLEFARAATRLAQGETATARLDESAALAKLMDTRREVESLRAELEKARTAVAELSAKLNPPPLSTGAPVLEID